MRSEVKAILLWNGRMLLNRCRDRSGSLYYTLPGGGQHPFEPMEEALIREVREETGLSIRVGRLAAVAEEISEDPAARAQYPDYAHRVHHIFLAERMGEAGKAPSEPDQGQEGCEWVLPAEAELLPLWPLQLRGRLQQIIRASGAQLLR